MQGVSGRLQVCPQQSHPTEEKGRLLGAPRDPLQRRCLRRDGPDQSAAQLGVFSGNTALETARSSTRHVLLGFHSDFSNGGFFVLNFHGEPPAPPPRARQGSACRVPVPTPPGPAGARELSRLGRLFKMYFIDF